ncbi:MAG TPA: AI-2E family transporter [Caulobacteraceae bacterium]|nr:AI-2E family transporter [Caulobacteraceae bacterium]
MPERADIASFVRKLIVVAALAIALVAAWRLREAELLLFGALLVAVFLRSTARQITRRSPIPDGWALAIATVGLAALLIAALSYFGLRIDAQMSDLLRSLPIAWAQFKRELGTTSAGRALDGTLNQLTAKPDVQWLLRLRGYAASVGIGLVDVLLIVAAGIYLAAQPDLYRRGFLRLIPQSRRELASRVFAECEVFLAGWMRAQLVAMITIGLLTTLGLWVLGARAPAALGIFAGLCEFIPVLGPVISAVPALLMALTRGWHEVLWTLGLYIAIHQFESNLLQPFLQRGMASVPPVLNLFALVVFWAFFGLLGVAFAAPLTVVCMVLVRVIYLHEAPEPPKLTGPRWLARLVERLRTRAAGDKPR